MRRLAANKTFVLKIALKAVVSGSLIYWVLSGLELNEILMAMRTANVWLFMLAFLLTVGLATFLRAYRWQVLLKAQRVNSSLTFLINSYMVSFFASNLLPSTIGGDAVRIYDTWRLGTSKSRAVTIVLVDRLLGTFALLVVAVVGLPFSTRLAASLPWLRPWLLLGMAAALCFSWLAFVPSKGKSALLRKIRLAVSSRPQKILDAIIEPLRTFHGKHAVLVWAFVLSLALQAVVVIHYYLIARALGVFVPLYDFFVIIPLAILIMMIPVSINAIGIRESVLIFFLAAYSVPPSKALALSWLVYGIVVITGLLGALVYVLRKEDIRKGLREAGE
jgi:glycosyltransferase 2 family protein